MTKFLLKNSQLPLGFLKTRMNTKLNAGSDYFFLITHVCIYSFLFMRLSNGQSLGISDDPFSFELTLVCE